MIIVAIAAIDAIVAIDAIENYSGLCQGIPRKKNEGSAPVKDALPL